MGIVLLHRQIGGDQRASPVIAIADGHRPTGGKSLSNDAAGKHHRIVKAVDIDRSDVRPGKVLGQRSEQTRNARSGQVGGSGSFSTVGSFSPLGDVSTVGSFSPVGNVSSPGSTVYADRCVGLTVPCQRLPAP